MMLHYVFRRVLMVNLVLLLPLELVWMKAIIFCIFKKYLTDIATIQISTIKFCIEECFNKNKLPITMLVALEKNFGQMVLCFASSWSIWGNNASLVGFQRLSKGNFTWKPKVYWRRNQDEYVLLERIRLFTGICIFQTRLLQN
jgi:hypothetical protein